LELLDSGRGLLPQRRRGERLGFLRERFFLCEGLLSLVPARGAVLLEAREEAVARLAEAFPDPLRHGPRHLADRLPLGLQHPQRLGGLHPVARLRERLGLLAQGFLLREVLGVLLGLLREVRVGLRLALAARRLEAHPERLALVLGSLLRQLPAAVELVAHPL